MATFVALAVRGTPAVAADCDAACGTTILPGQIAGETWTAAGSPYCVTGDITLVNVTIEAGVCVLVDGPYRIDVLQNLSAVGTADDPIIFTEEDADDNWLGLRFANSAGVSELRHCTITHATDSGLRIIDSSPTVVDCRILHNTTSDLGGGLYVDVANGDVLITDTMIAANTSASHGGGVHALMGGGYTLEMHGCEIYDNIANPNYANVHANRAAGGIYFIPDDGVLVLDNCEIVGNSCWSNCLNWNCTTTSWGGAIYADGGDVSLTACTLIGNRAQAVDSQVGGGEHNNGLGGAIYFTGAGNTLSVTNTIITCNTAYRGGSTASGRGNAIYVHSGEAIIDNATLARNGSVTTLETEALWTQPGATLTVSNSILYNNNPYTDEDYGPQIAGSGTTTVQYSDVHGGWEGDGNVDFNPVFLADDCACPDYRISEFSLVIDAGDPAEADGCSPPGAGTDAPDMGAHGGPGNCSWSCWIPSDVDCDGVIGIEDLLAILSQWGACEYCDADVCKDGMVDIQDLLAVLSNWG